MKVKPDEYFIYPVKGVYGNTILYDLYRGSKWIGARYFEESVFELFEKDRKKDEPCK